MGSILITCILLTLIVPSFALPFSIRSSVQNGHSLTASVSTGIVIAIFVIFIIPLFWCAYRLGTRTRQSPGPLFVPHPPIFNYNGNSNIPSSGQIARPQPVHKKVSQPTSRS